MDTAQVLLLIALTIAGGALAFRYWVRSQATKQAAEVTRDVYPVWAAQGPFDSGAQSARAMRSAYLAVRGPEETERMSDAIAKHVQAFDADPGVWEKLRQESLTLAAPKTQDHVTVAKGFAVADTRTLTNEQIGQLSHFLGERSQLTQEEKTYLFEGHRPTNPLAATTVDTTWMLICMRSAGIDRDSAASALREIIWRMLNRLYPAKVAEKSIEGINIETQVFLADQHQSGDPESQSRVAIYAVHLLYDLDFKEHGELMGKMAASFLLGGDIGTVITETDRILGRSAVRQ